MAYLAGQFLQGAVIAHPVGSELSQPAYPLRTVVRGAFQPGALLHFPTWWIAPLVLAYVAIRILAKRFGGLLASRLRPEGVRLPGSFGLALTPQGGLSLAMAISFVLIYVETGSDNVALNVFFATVVIAVGNLSMPVAVWLGLVGPAGG